MEGPSHHGATALTIDEARAFAARIAAVVRERDRLREEVKHWREVMAELETLRRFLDADAAGIIAGNAASNGHLAHALTAVADDDREQAAGDEQAVDTEPPLHTARHTGETAAERHSEPEADTSYAGEMLAADRGEYDAGDEPSIAATNPDDNPATDGDSDALQADEDASAISAPTPTEHDALVSPGVPSPTPRLVPDNPIDPVEASSPPAGVGGKPPPGTLLAKILDLIEQSARPKRPWQVRKELGLPRLPCAELSKLVSEGHLVRVKDACYGLPNRDYNGMVSAEGDET